MEQDLIAFFTTKAQANEFVSRLTAIEDQIYETHFSLEKAVGQQLGIQKSDKFLKLMRENNVASDSPAAIKEFLGKMKKTIASLPMISLTIAFEPADSTLHALNDWFVMNCKKQFLLDLTVDPKLIGGAIVKYNGRFIDCSRKEVFATILQQAFQPKPKSAVHQTPPARSSDAITHFHMGR